MTSTDVILAPRAPGFVSLMSPAIELARMISNTEFVPKALRGRDGAICAAILTADELGVGAMTGLAQISIIDGKPALSATLMRALVLSRGHDMWFEDLAVTKATACGRRRGSEAITRVTWTMEMARTAGLLGKDNWKKYQRSMLEARASAELCRLIFADCLAGLMHSVEELEDGVVIDAPPSNGTGSDDTSNRRRRRIPSTATDVSAPANDRPPLPGDPETPPADSAPADAPPPPQEPPADDNTPGPMLRKVFALFGQLDIKEREDRLAVCTLIVGRPIESSKDLAVPEIDAVLNTLNDHVEGRVRIFKRGVDGRWEIAKLDGESA